MGSVVASRRGKSCTGGENRKMTNLNEMKKVMCDEDLQGVTVFEAELLKEKIVTESFIILADKKHSTAEKHYWRGYYQGLLRVLQDNQVPTRLKEILESDANPEASNEMTPQFREAVNRKYRENYPKMKGDYW
jgi:hypothetical protein